MKPFDGFRLDRFRPEDVDALRDEHIGLCLGCGKFQRRIKPDAWGRQCPACGENQVYGIDALVLMGWIVIDPNALSLHTEVIP
jgi:hypothetical protein